MATKLFRNTTSDPINVLGVGEIPAYGQVSMVGEYLPPVIIENYPGLVDVTAEEAAGADIPDSVEFTADQSDTPPAETPVETPPTDTPTDNPEAA